MVRFRPFNAYLPNLNGRESILERISPPYDVIEGTELIRLKSKPYNVAKITLGRYVGDYGMASEEFADWISKRVIVKDERESYYLYHQSFEIDGRRYSRIGIIGLLGLEEYGEGGVIPHEETNPKVKEDRLNLLRATATDTESIFGLIDDWGKCAPDKIEKSAHKLFECQDDSGTLHSISRISDPTVTNDMTNLISGKRILIADGHHRYETALRYSKEAPGIEGRKWVLATLASSKDPGLVVFPTHRLLKAPKITEEEMVETMRIHFNLERTSGIDVLRNAIQEADRPSLGVVFRSGSAYKAELAGSAGNDPMCEIDSFVFQEVMLKKVIYAIARPEEVTIDYDHDASSVESKMTSGAYDMSVLLRPPKLTTIWKLAASGRRMPKKTTYFWPKIWSGFVFYRMA